ncbi:hypothetical protein TW95_gp1056 [Pandoravirus inopinatum]|uniref:Uncharacterized protein n=1 Tax=Pandoravirus inopinatum TaxID=1605721 RepID=A0A0B5J7E9_9VIRU|nr:hypothetical protein TW95_gp1056 [Pandoravirus inopinatum]AJF97790.1 hypothetical protein [Pandoravirus inopinatum]
MQEAIIGRMQGGGASWWCCGRESCECIAADPPTDGPPLVWLQRALACVSPQGVVDWPALLGVGFAHDLALARRLVAAHAHPDDGISINNVFARRDSHPLRINVLGETHWAPAPADALVPSTRAWSWETADLPLIPGGDDVIAGLVALAAMQSPLSMRARGLGVSMGPMFLVTDTWAMRIGHALATQSVALTPSAWTREKALAHALLDVIGKDAALVDHVDCDAWVCMNDPDRAPRFGAPLPEPVAGDAAEVYECAINAWRHADLVVYPDETEWGRDTGENTIAPPWLGVVSSLCTFVSVGERLYSGDSTQPTL